jgi:replicative DNA helicase
MYSLANRTTPSEELELIENKAKEFLTKADEIETEVSDTTQDAILDIDSEIQDLENGIVKPLAFEFSDLTDLKKIVTGLKSHEFAVIAARPGCGKTSMLTQFIMHNLKKGNRGIFYSLEMGTGEIIKRLVCQESMTNYKKLEYSKDELRKYKDCFNRNKKLLIESLKIRHSSDLRKMDVEVQTLASAGMIDFIALDYIQLITGMDAKQNRATQIAEATRTIKKWTIDYGIPVISAAQLNRANETDNRRPRASDLRESGSIEQDADIIILTHLPTKNSQGLEQENSNDKEINMIIAKNRNGSTGSCDVLFKQNYTRFFNLENKNY